MLRGCREFARRASPGSASHDTKEGGTPTPDPPKNPPSPSPASLHSLQEFYSSIRTAKGRVRAPPHGPGGTKDGSWHSSPGVSASKAPGPGPVSMGSSPSRSWHLPGPAWPRPVVHPGSPSSHCQRQLISLPGYSSLGTFCLCLPNRQPCPPRYQAP